MQIIIPNLKTPDILEDEYWYDIEYDDPNRPKHKEELNIQMFIVKDQSIKPPPFFVWFLYCLTIYYYKNKLVSKYFMRLLSRLL